MKDAAKVKNIYQIKDYKGWAKDIDIFEFLNISVVLKYGLSLSMQLTALSQQFPLN